MFAALRAGYPMLFYEAHEFIITPAIAGPLKFYAFFRAEIFDDLVGAETLMTVTAFHKRIRETSKMS